MKYIRSEKLILTVALSLCLLPSMCFSQVIGFNFEAIWTLLTPTGEFLNNSSAASNEYDGNRTNIAGSLLYDASNGNGAFTISSFMLNGSLATVGVMTMQDAGSNLNIGNIDLNWNGYFGIPISLVWDTTGLVNAAAAGLFIGDNLIGNQLIQGGVVAIPSLGGATPASTDTKLEMPNGPGSSITITYPLGPSLLATTTWDTSPVAPPVVIGQNPSGGLPLVADLVVDVTNGDIGIGGSPMQTDPFPGYSINIDFNKLEVTSVSSVPVPAAVWLFGSGLVGLMGMATRKRPKV